MGLKWFLNFEGKTRIPFSPSVQKRVLLREVCGHVQYGESKLSEQQISYTPCELDMGIKNDPLDKTLNQYIYIYILGCPAIEVWRRLSLPIRHVWSLVEGFGEIQPLNCNDAHFVT